MSGKVRVGAHNVSTMRGAKFPIFSPFFLATGLLVSVREAIALVRASNVCVPLSEG